MNLVTSRQIISELLLGDIISLAYVLHANVTPVILNSLPVFLLKPSILVANIIIASIVSFKLLIATLDWGPKNQKLATAIISGPSQKLLGKKTSEASLEGVTKKSVRFSNRAPKIYWTDFRQDGTNKNALNNRCYVSVCSINGNFIYILVGGYILVCRS